MFTDYMTCHVLTEGVPFTVLPDPRVGLPFPDRTVVLSCSPDQL